MWERHHNALGFVDHRCTRDPSATTHKCTKCGEEKPLSEFYAAGLTSAGRPHKRGDCKRCFLSGVNKTAGYLKKYGLNPGSFALLIKQQDGRCAICAVSFGDTKPHVDHDHSTEHVRGLLCNNCNLGLGHFKDDRAAISRALDYLA